MAYKMKYLLEFRETKPFKEDGYPLPEELSKLPAYKEIEYFTKLPDHNGLSNKYEEIVWTPGVSSNVKNKGSVPGYRKIQFPIHNYMKVFVIKPPNKLVYDANYSKSYDIGFDLNTLEDWNRLFLLIYHWLLIDATGFYNNQEDKYPAFGFNKDWAIFSLIERDKYQIEEFAINYIEDYLRRILKMNLRSPNRLSFAYNKVFDLLDISHNDVAIDAIASYIKKDVKKDISNIFIIDNKDLRNAVANKLKLKLDQKDIDMLGSLKDLGIF
jgi:hypothetical protein